MVNNYICMLENYDISETSLMGSCFLSYNLNIFKETSFQLNEIKATDLHLKLVDLIKKVDTDE